ncbi:MAG: glycosyltransferase family 9 protein [Methylotenera sp.]|nr:glycosyltransferase family 9 protein [Oligoflexia bacterium]
MSDIKPPSSVKSPLRPLRCLVIQLGRLGDTLQSLMALRAAKQLYPQLEIHLITHEAFSSAAKEVPWLASVITLPTDKLVSPILQGKLTERQSLGELARWVAPLIQDRWDYVLNWSFSDASSFLTGLLASRVKLGYSRRKDNALSCADGWSHYVQAVIQEGSVQNIHLTDILTTQLLTALQIHEGEPAEESESSNNSSGASKFFFSSQDRKNAGGPNPAFLPAHFNDPFVKWGAIQLGAEGESRQWSPQKWAKLASYLLRRHPEYRIVLLGDEKEKTLEKSFLKALDPDLSRDRVISKIGKLSFDSWTTLISGCQWLMASDAPVIHLASVLGTRVLNISVGAVRWNETGPYGNGHYIVSSSLPCTGCESLSRKAAAHSCADSITPEGAYAVWSYASSEWAHRRQLPIETHFSQLSWSSELSHIRIHRSKIRGANDGGGVFYEPMVQRSMELQEWNSHVMGHIARAWYCGWVPPVGQELDRRMLSSGLMQGLRQLNESSEVLMKICAEAERAASTLQQKSAKLPSERIMSVRDRDTLRDLGKKLNDLDQLFERLSQSQAALKPFSQIAKVLMHNLQGQQLADLGRESAESYQLLSQGIVLLRDWVKHTLTLAKPVAVRSTTETTPLRRLHDRI